MIGLDQTTAREVANRQAFFDVDDDQGESIFVTNKEQSTDNKVHHGTFMEAALESSIKEIYAHTVLHGRSQDIARDKSDGNEYLKKESYNKKRLSEKAHVLVGMLREVGISISPEQEAKVEEVLGDYILNSREDIEALLSVNQPRLNEYGLPMEPLEQEVAELLDKAPLSLPKYHFKQYGSPVGYVKHHFGKYLNCFNGGKGDYLYLDQFGELLPKFKSTFTSYTSANKQELCRQYPPNGIIIPPMGCRLDKVYEQLIKKGIDPQITVSRFHTLIRRKK